MSAAPDYQAQYQAFKQRGLKLDMSRGKPAPEQLDLSNALTEALPTYKAADGTDARNYGGSVGLPEARALFAELLDVPAAQVVVDSSASLSLMHDVIVYALLNGVPGHAPWVQNPVTFLCPVPGYDRHFAICEARGIKMINVPMNADGPDMDLVEKLVAEDASIKGMWLVPKYSNPGGVVFSDQVVERLAAMKTAAPDFRLMWDDAYRFHHLGEQKLAVANILQACEKAGNPDRAIVFASSSKVSWAGSGVAALAASPANIAWWTKHAGFRSIGPDKINQLRHVRFLKDLATVEALMEQHRQLLKPKFDAVLAQFQALLGDVSGVSWTQPQGGYFIDLVTPDGAAKRTVALAKEAGITLTPAGAAFPYGLDPKDRHIRIAPSFPSLDEINQAAQGIALSLRLALTA
ncbi:MULTISPECIES: aminotransferase class I/II-fold pyridoxal phosphate-dependent enzyme [unclassified Duganella]|jgi:DNA-binding transcriptional MocR family regulator|uniref:aminotransferase class I/II-fold pyridoxal phosphate-dependent enzyme n=1 Tax=unclassified Duganella TaxID=2636909 RepID=UPI00088D9C5B|nr:MULTISPECIES: aminotransferase class I/II-fold pyridoxal phosphate-dependent enzyme [unclassified Duganella]SDH31696.1 DNA-binding transcriptional regulator, MocR family, contains an aminotransferase domain [Duganella sp. OV458]SDK48487.1 DNA-binding transcriptional regulator, MocR family, contains an aminotransferase domain [Duganella sp. OV510]